MEFKEPDFVPMLLQGQSRKDLEKFFDGAIPVPGERVEMYCYSATETNVFLKWRVVPNDGGKPQPAADKTL